MLSQKSTRKMKVTVVILITGMIMCCQHVTAASAGLPVGEQVSSKKRQLGLEIMMI